MTVLRPIAIVATSTRTPRVGPSIAAFVHDKLQPAAAKANIALHQVHLSDFKLPIYDESVIPAMVPEQASFSHPHSKAWSAEMKRHDGYVFVVPEYNYGMSGGTKNAIDYLVHEIRGKPVVIVSYGVVGGSFASEQLRHTFEKLGLKVAGTRPQLAFENGREGPDLFAAMGKGELGEGSKELWGREKGDEILKGFEELVELLGEKA
ncbi:hypothetical protein AJ79_06377 [Helicocarpus griseus UAMH5409]|uniref:NADPH-dependent FMN reductase-like domain-containing protein n=1 Tax=Helicocarpus griseus UAMH5409 TaxID=1447875 RepID=A0A2B7XDV4_9EURO|nr:hypothetical protein AJ79_06377 [Helicocarpus griseus UAMH5409]